METQGVEQVVILSYNGSKYMVADKLGIMRQPK